VSTVRIEIYKLNRVIHVRAWREVYIGRDKEGHKQYDEKQFLNETTGYLRDALRLVEEALEA